MEIIHHVCFNNLSSQDLLKAIDELGIHYASIALLGNGEKLITFDISEADTNWDAVFSLLKKYKGLDIYRGGDIFDTFFSNDEIRGAEWLRLVPTFDQGYPEPKNGWPFKQLSLINVCSRCGIYEQDRPFRLSKEPKLGKNSFMSQIACREVFATRAVFLAFEEMGATGYESWQAIIHRTKQPSKNVHQLYIPNTTRPGLMDTEIMRQVACQNCKITKYYPHTKGMMVLRRESLVPNVDFMRTYEWFGVGLVSFREIIVSNRIAQLILDKGWQGVQLKAVELI